MQLADLLKEELDVENKDVWENERTPTPVRYFSVRLHSMGLSFREVEAVLDWLGVDCCQQAIWYWKETLAETQSDLPTVAPSRVAVDEKQIEIDGKKVALCFHRHRIKLLLKVGVFNRRGTNPAAALLHRLTERHDVADTEFLVDAGGYMTALSPRSERSSRLQRPEPHRKVLPDHYYANRPLSFVLAGQSVKRETLAGTVQIPLQPPSTELSVRWLDSN